MSINRINRQPQASRRRPLQIETLEDRRVLSSLHSVGLTVADSQGATFELDTGNYGFRGGFIDLSMQVTGTNGLDPAAVEVRDSRGELVAAQLVNADLTASTSYVVVRLTNDVYQIKVAGDVDTTGDALLEVSQVGDLDGNRTVDDADLTAFFESFGASPGGDEYSALADANLSGFIGFRDAFHLFRNWGTHVTDVASDLPLEDRGHPFDVDGNRLIELNDALAIVNALHNNLTDERFDANGDQENDLQDALFIVNQMNLETTRTQAENQANDLDTELSAIPVRDNGPDPNSPLTPTERAQIAQVMTDTLLIFLPEIPSEAVKQAARDAILDYLISISTPFVDLFLEDTFAEYLN